MKKINNIIFILFILLAILVGSHHEPWTDESQSWMIARDASVKEIVWDISRYEGTFPLWFLILKLFITLGLQYKYIFVVPIIISGIGLWIFLNKIEVPIFVKILFPFSYYIFYQYTVIARSYCLLFLAFSIWTITYKKRDKSPLKYILSLIFISFISMHGMVISGALGILYFIECIKEKRIKNYLKYFIILGITWIIEVIILIPASDLYMNVAALFSIKEIIISIMNTIFDIGNIYGKIYNLITVLIFILLFLNIILFKNKDMIYTIIGVFLFMFVIRLQRHHLGILFELIMFAIICNYDEIKKINKYNEKIFLIVLILYAIHSGIASTNDYFKAYSGAKEMAEYIREMNYENEEIFGFGYRDISLEPYFEQPIFKNWQSTVYKWSINNVDFYNFCNIEKIDKSQFTSRPKFILLGSNETPRENYIMDYIENTGLYEIEHQTMGHQFFKNSYSGLEGYTLYRLKDI